MKKPKQGEIEKLMTKLDLSYEEALDLWKCDNDLDTNEEQEELQKTAYKAGNEIKKVKRGPQKKPRKAKEKKVDNTKHDIITTITKSLSAQYNTEIIVMTVDKKIRFKVGDEWFTLDLVRMTKKTLEKEGLLEG